MMPFFSNARRIWSAYAAILLLLAIALSWFSWTTIALDLKVEENRRQVEWSERQALEQEKIGYALWRMDWLLTPFIAQEAARNYWMYESVLPFSENTAPEVWPAEVEQAPTLQRQPQSPSPVPSPLLNRPSELVKLHFQIDENNRFTSPQVPQGETFSLVCSQGLVTASEVSGNQKRLDEIASLGDFETMRNACSIQNLPDLHELRLDWTPSSNEDDQPLQQAYVPLQTDSLEPDRQYSLQDSVNSALKSKSKGEADFDSRAVQANQIALSQRVWNEAGKAGSPTPEPQKPVVEGAMRAIWFGDELVLARRVEKGPQTLIQGCWLDWAAIKELLLGEIKETFPSADLIPRPADVEVDFHRALATLPADLVVDPIRAYGRSNAHDAIPDSMNEHVVPQIVGPTPSRSSCIALGIAWGGFLLTALTTAWLIFGIINLSERRASFASAVTHELRTPLTTFRLYSEMLDSGMVSDEESRKTYTEGLVRESDRLCRLVENVLQFSRLERRDHSIPTEPLPIRDLMQRIADRCQPRVEAAGMELEWNLDEELKECLIATSPDSVEQIVFNLVDNACKYGANGTESLVRIDARREVGWLVLGIRDFGPGIDSKMIKQLYRPFSRSSDETAGTAAGVGLGLSLARQITRQLGGRLAYCDAYPGATFELRLRLQNPQKGP